MTTRILAVLGACAALLLGTGCGGGLFRVNLFVVGEQTALEKQVLGSYNALGEDLLIYSSVRGVDPNGELRLPPELTESQRAAIAALRDREYNRDDIDRILAAGRAGEDSEGMLEPRGDAGTLVAGLAEADIERLIDEENTDRAALMARLVETSGAESEEQRREVAWIFANLNHDTAPDRAWIEDREGNWRRK